MSSLRAEIVTRQKANRNLLTRAAKYERRFRVVFETFVVFPAGALKSTRNVPQGKRVTAAISRAAEDTKLATLTRVANMARPSRANRQEYLDTLLAAYRELPNKPQRQASAITVAPKRAGMMLGRALNWLPPGALTPHMKRIPSEQGLIVGVERFAVPVQPFRTCCVIDGAIASGATTMTLMALLHEVVEKFELFTVHATEQGINNLLHYGIMLGSLLHVNAAFISGELNEKYYAVDQTNPNRLIVGDLGDTIGPLLED